MADFYGCLETTSFRVKDRAAWDADPDVKWILGEARSEGFYEDGERLSFGWYGQYPSVVLTRSTGDDDDDEVDVRDVIARHIVPGDVCQIGVSGNEKLRYIGGPLVWVTSRGVLSLDGQTAWDDVLTVPELLATIRSLSARAEDLLTDGRILA